MFDQWDYCSLPTEEDHSAICLAFSDGQVCGNGHGRKAFVHIICDIGDRDSTEEHLFDISEPMTCQYHMVCELE